MRRGTNRTWIGMDLFRYQAFALSLLALAALVLVGIFGE
jgi:hypothetical protein